MKLSVITPKQQEILKLLYRYRFLERKQMQAFLDHKDKRPTARWLKELKEQQFIGWFYDPDNSDEKSKPAIYFLSINGMRYLRQTEDYLEEELRKRYKDATRQSDFIARCLLLADCGLHLEARNKGDTNARYEYALEADYADPDSGYASLNGNEFIHPSLAFTKEEGVGENLICTTYSPPKTKPALAGR